MQLKMYRHLWGIDEPPRQSVPRIREAGYDGIETGVPAPDQRGAFKALLDENGLGFIAMLFTGGQSVREHLDSLRAQVAALPGLDPACVVVNGGADWFSPAEALEFFRGALEVERDSGYAFAHETHRGRVLFNPWAATRILTELEDVHLCADFSHWVCVCERLLDARDANIVVAASRVRHLHSRVGYEQGPQVPDPRAPEFAEHLARHEAWWDLVWASQRARGVEVSTMTPEFGPPPYLHTLPYTQQPVADLWEVCNWQAERQRRRFAGDASAAS
jgi:hypothetical protein